MQASLAVLAGVFAFLAWMDTSDLRWLLGGAVLLASWPYTVISVLPTNTRLMDTPLGRSGPGTRTLIKKWGDLHAVRTALGALSTLIFLWALS